MKYRVFRDYRFSQLTLGTVQLGLNYGISNSEGIPDQEERFRMLDFAARTGINTLDTARQYGFSERVLGDFLEKTGDRYALNLVSKFKISPAHFGNLERAWNEVHQSVTESLLTLKINQLPVCLLHKGMEEMRDVIGILPPILSRLKEEGLIDIGGVSVFRPEDVEYILDEDLIEATQIPLNIFDQRLLKTGLLHQLRAQSKLVFARSVFLQGLFFMNPGQLNGTPKKAEHLLIALQNLAERARMSVAQLAFSFVRDLPAVDSVVFGAVNQRQIQQNTELLAGPPIPSDLLAEIQDVFDSVEEEIITPAVWKS
ncbi:aldo/keto reductase [Larkinella rosea]|uniref:Aldo/keto reductase n=1 Tax=Larkinella rosea TaxID=2025312 RepID=A0A3P1C309_9BACT|nr:aldo/keto reductase [Larkinella rosea]RRB07486.1 aldo/keto reductase [Larkinella rosea]